MRVIATHAASDWLIAVIVEHQIGVSAGTMQPPIDPLVILMNGSGDGHFGGGAIRVGGIRRDRFRIETLSQFGIRFPDMTLQCMAALSLIAGQIIASRRFESDMLYRFRRSLCWFGVAMKK